MKKDELILMLAGFVLGVAVTLVCIPQDKEVKREPEVVLPIDPELNREVEEFILHISNTYHLDDVHITVDLKRED